MDNLVKIDTNTKIVATTFTKRFVFISDLHFDCFHKGLSREELDEQIEKMKLGIREYKKTPEFVEDDAFVERENLFIRYVNEHFSNDILILAGDYYTNYNQTLSFVKKLEESKITSYFVLGNHDFASNNGTTFKDIISLFDTETGSHKYCKFLMTGKKYYHEDVCIIGDTGWSSTSLYRVSARGSFTNRHFPKALYTREGKKWSVYAKNILSKEKKILVVTHFPQMEIAHSNMHWIDWPSAKLLLDSNNCWKIFGHTHQPGHFQHYNNACSQQGYRYRVSMENFDYMRYSKRDFGILEKVADNESSLSFSLASAISDITPFYSNMLIQDPKKELEAVKSISKRGYMRAGNGDNKRALSQLLADKAEYISHVKKQLKAVEFTQYIGYVLGERVSYRAVEAVKSSINILENLSPSNVRPFMTAFVITAYAYNGMISLLESMRPVDDYDIMRWFMMFATIKKYNISPDEIETVRRNVKECLHYQNAPLYLPKVNDKSLKISEIRALLSSTPLLADNVVKAKIASVPEHNFNVGDLVAHKAFGVGKIVSLRTNDAGTKLEIEFGERGIKSVMASFVTPEVSHETH